MIFELRGTITLEGDGEKRWIALKDKFQLPDKLLLEFVINVGTTVLGFYADNKSVWVASSDGETKKLSVENLSASYTVRSLTDTGKPKTGETATDGEN